MAAPLMYDMAGGAPSEWSGAIDAGSAAVAVAIGGGQEQAQLVDQVKQMQRSDPNAKEQWINYVALHGSRNRDPAKHDAAFLHNFLVQVHSGAKFSADNDLGATALVNCLRGMQKRSPAFKAIWTQWNTQYGKGFNDPSKHDAGYHIKFFDQLSQQACLAVGIDSMAMAGGEHPSKRMRDASGMAIDTSSLIVDGGMKATLVAQVKQFQRSGQDPKELWCAYADTYLGGVRDPARHDAATLHEFCVNHRVPSVDASALAGPFGMMGACAAPTGMVVPPPSGMLQLGDAHSSMPSSLPSSLPGGGFMPDGSFSSIPGTMPSGPPDATLVGMAASPPSGMPDAAVGGLADGVLDGMAGAGGIPGCMAGGMQSGIPGMLSLSDSGMLNGVPGGVLDFIPGGALGDLPSGMHRGVTGGIASGMPPRPCGVPVPPPPGGASLPPGIPRVVMPPGSVVQGGMLDAQAGGCGGLRGGSWTRPDMMSAS